MLLLREKTATVDGITFFADDSDDSQFWYQPETLQLAKRDGKPVFALIKYTGNDSSQRGGYLNFEVNTALDESDLQRAFEKYLKTLNVEVKTPRKSPVAYDKGSVSFFVLDVGNANGELISAQSPSLIGSNSAIFSAKLTPEQAVILEAAFSQSEAPAAVAYNLTYTGITPALKVEVTAKFENIYTEFDTQFGANIPIPVETPASFWLGFDSVIQKLQQNQSLVIKVTEGLPGDEAEKQREWALQFVKEEILKSFFTATLQPNGESNAQSQSASDAILESLIASAKAKESKTEDKDKKEEQAGGLLPCASLEIKLVRKEETKTLNFNYRYSKALSQSAVPQNFIGSDLLQVSKEAPYYLEVNVNDPFFQQIDYTVLGPDGFSEYGLKAASVQLTYDGTPYTAPAFTTDDDKWIKNLARSQQENALFSLQTEFVFKSAIASGWEGSTSYSNPVETASTLFNLDPADFLTLASIDILPDRSFDWEKYNQVQVKLEWRDDTEREKSKTFTFSPSKSESQEFKYRYLTTKPWTLNYSITWYPVGGQPVTKPGAPNPAGIVIPAVPQDLA
ncbi:hypothetical protein [Candidatus Pantoea multigeneris]|uniref:Uncharacterized protein n=1 Tax=Candidatus Pantoea multigeneris TaxID=2608357 RepID=A0ABX0RC08_9GAMM|nr:hypothetical protein [Pantoea multigeneris]NIF22881.1 hypothetical protein [Pantoea multigeneris]